MSSLKMKVTMRGLAGLALAAALTTVSLAQRVGEDTEIKPLPASAPISAVVDSTSNYFPQINLSQKSRPVRPSNPKVPPIAPQPNNGMETGSVSTTQVGFQPSSKWPGISFTGSYPPDPDIAVGPTHVVQVVNGAVAFYQKNGTRVFQQPDSPSGFWSGLNATNFIFDPKAFYDHLAKRFFIVELELDQANSKSYILLAVSDDSNPVGTWYKYRIDVAVKRGDNNHWLDYPGLGYNRDGFVISGNMFPFAAGDYFGQVIALPKAPMLSGQAVTPTKFETLPQIQFSRTPDASMSSVFGVARTAFSGSTLALFAVRNLNSTPVLSQTNVAVPTYTGSVTDVPARGGMLDVIGDRIMSTYARAGRVFTTHSTKATDGKAQVSWYEINPGNWPVSGTPALVQSGNVASTTFHNWMPSIAQNSLGDIVLVYSRANSSTFPEAVYSARKATDARGVMGAPIRFGESLGVHQVWRFGDYSDVEVDPANNYTFFGVANTFGLNSMWETSIASWNVSLPSSDVNGTPPNGVAVVNGTNTGGNLASLTTIDRNAYRVSSAGITNVGQVTDTDMNFPVTNRATVSALDIVVSASRERGEIVTGTLYIWNYSTNAWVVLKQGNLPSGTSAYGISGRISANALNFISTGNNVKIRLRSFEGINRLRGTPSQHHVLIDNASLVQTNG